jgi:L-asparagine transporter-like permease
MYNFILGLHNLLRWIIILLLLINIIRHFAAIQKPFAAIDKKLGLWLMIAAHTQLLIGLYEWLAGAWGLHNITNNGMGQVMQNSTERFFAVEHLVSMLIAIALITIARGIFRKQLPDAKKHRRCILLYVIALIIIIAMVPWPGMEGIDRSLVPKFSALLF